VRRRLPACPFKLRVQCLRQLATTDSRYLGMTSTSSPTAAVPDLVQQLCTVVDQLEDLFPGRKFTLDGHLVGSIGEALAADQYGLDLLPTGTKTHDATAPDGRLVQIKLTQGSAVALRSCPDHMIVLRMERTGSTTEVYNGPGTPAWNAAGKMQSNGQRRIGTSKLLTLMDAVLTAERLPLTGTRQS
jgi:hypothetical protein